MASQIEQGLFAFEFVDAESTRRSEAFADLFAEEFGVELIRDPTPSTSSGAAGDKGLTEAVMCILSLPMALHAAILLYKELVLERRLSRVIQFVKDHELKVRVKNRGGRKIDLQNASPSELREFLEVKPVPKQPKT